MRAHTHTHTCTRTLPSLGAWVGWPFLLCTPHNSAPGTEFLNSTQAASPSSSRPRKPIYFHIIVLSLSGCLSHQPESFWRTSSDCHHPNLGTQVLSREGMGKATPALPSRWQQFPILGIPTPTLPAVGMETPNCAGARELPDTQPFLQCSFIGTRLIQACKCLQLSLQTHFLCQPWGINKNMTPFLPFMCPYLMRGQTLNTHYMHTGQ